MILYYAMGGGLGHLMRATAFITMNRIRKFRVVTASPFAARLFEPAALFMIPREFENHRPLLTKYLQDILDHNLPDTVVIDTFSHGILGELNGLHWKKSRLYYITRRLKWEQYVKRIGSDMEFQKSFVLEPPESGHLNLIKEVSGEIIDYSLQYPHHEIDIDNPVSADTGHEKWLVIHSGPVHEVKNLISYAREKAATLGSQPEMMVISQVNPLADKTRWFDLCPAHGYFRFAARLITACGFNVMEQARGLEIPHDFIPFGRKYDDQFWRAEWAKKNGFE